MEDKNAVWLGGHCRGEDKPRGRKRSFLKETLLREVHEELRIRPESGKVLGPRCAVWDRSNERSARHLALFYEYSWTEERSVLHQQVFRETNNKDVFTYFETYGNLGKLDEILENWSRHYLRYLLKEQYEGEPLQAALHDD